jgi:hypothetical protein
VTNSIGARLRITLVAGFLLAAGVRVVWLCAFEDNWDLRIYRQFVEAAPRGGDLYVRTQYPYSPLWAFVLLGVSRVASLLSVPFPKVVGALLLLGDAATSYLVFRIARDCLARTQGRSAGAALLFFSNPVSVFITGFHLQWENLAILCLLAAVWSAGRERTRSVSSAAFLSLSLLVKHVAFFHPLLFAVRAKGRSRRLLFLVPYFVFLASFLPYWTARRAVFHRVFGYRSLSEDYGTAMLRKLPGMPDWVPTALFVAAASLTIVALRRVEIGRASLLLFLVLLLFAPGIVEYYFIWPIALGSLFGGAGYAVFTLVVSAFFLGSPDGLGLPLTHLPGWHGIWWATLFWLMWEIRMLAKSAPSPRLSGRPRRGDGDLRSRPEHPVGVASRDPFAHPRGGRG